MISHSNGVLAHLHRTRHRVAPRVYWFVYQSFLHSRSPGKYETTLAEIGKFVGCSRYSVSRSLRYLRKLGVIEYRRTRTGLEFTSVKEGLT